MRKLRRVVLVLLSLLLVGVLSLVGLLLVWSYPGQPRPFLDARGRPVAGSVSEKLWISIGGVEQGMILKGRDATRPVLLYLHGGMPDYFLTQRFPTGLDEEFVVCWWDQRGAGLSFDPARAGEAVTVDLLVADAIEVTDYLRRRFGQERIWLMGHSGGTFLGMRVIARAPERFHAYLGVAQMADQRASEREAWAFLVEEFRRRGDSRMVAALEAAPVTATEVPDAYLAVRDDAMHRAGVGTMRAMGSVAEGLFLASLQNRELTLGEKIGLWRGKASTGVSSMWKEMLSSDLSALVPQVEVPVYFFHGVHDRTCSYAEAVKYFDRLAAPRKGFYTFAESAHSPLFEEPERLRTLVREDVLRGTNQLADRR